MVAPILRAETSSAESSSPTFSIPTAIKVDKVSKLVEELRGLLKSIYNSAQADDLSPGYSGRLIKINRLIVLLEKQGKENNDKLNETAGKISHLILNLMKAEKKLMDLCTFNPEKGISIKDSLKNYRNEIRKFEAVFIDPSCGRTSYSYVDLLINSLPSTFDAVPNANNYIQLEAYNLAVQMLEIRIHKWYRQTHFKLKVDVN